MVDLFSNKLLNFFLKAVQFKENFFCSKNILKMKHFNSMFIKKTMFLKRKDLETEQ